MFGDSSIYNSFAGHRVAAVLLVFKSFSYQDTVLVLHCTPVAMGMGYLRECRHSPYHLDEEVEAQQDAAANP
jgi:hypothetical protein